MEWDTIWPVIAFIGGFGLNWAKESMAASKAVARAQQDNFDKLQRDTHFELQDVINEFWRACRTMVNTWDEGAELQTQPQSPDYKQAESAYLMSRQRAKTLCSRLAAQDVRAAVEHAIDLVSWYQAKNFDPTQPATTVSDWHDANSGVEDAVEKLGALVSEPPSV